MYCNDKALKVLSVFMSIFFIFNSVSWAVPGGATVLQKRHTLRGTASREDEQTTTVIEAKLRDTNRSKTSSAGENLYLGIDSSTQSVTFYIIDLDTGEVIATHQEDFRDPYYNDFDAPEGHIEAMNKENTDLFHANPIMWAVALDRGMSALQSKFEADGGSMGNIKTISGAGQQHGTVYLNKKAVDRLKNLDPEKPLGEQLEGIFSRETSPIWKDKTTTKETKQIEDKLGGAQKTMERTGSKAELRFSFPQILRFYNECKESGSDAWDDTYAIVNVAAFIGALLTGQARFPWDYSDGAGTNAMDIRKQEWIPEIDELAPGVREKLTELRPSNEIIANVSPYLTRYGIAEDTEVVNMVGDNPSSMTGQAIVKPGKISISLGTSFTLFTYLKKGDLKATFKHIIGNVFMEPTGKYMKLVCFQNGGTALKAIRDKYITNKEATVIFRARYRRGPRRNNKKDDDKISTIKWEIFEELVGETPAGNNGAMMVTQDTQEEAVRIPYNPGKPFTRNLSDLRKNNRAQVLRAAAEGQIYFLKWIADQIGLDVKEISLTGGVSRNKAIRQMIADIFDADIRVLKEDREPVPMGSAERAAKAHYDATHVRNLSWEKLTSKFAQYEEEVTTPIKENSDIYRAHLNEYGQMVKEAMATVSIKTSSAGNVTAKDVASKFIEWQNAASGKTAPPVSKGGKGSRYNKKGQEAQANRLHGELKTVTAQFIRTKEFKGLPLVTSHEQVDDKTLIIAGVPVPGNGYRLLKGPLTERFNGDLKTYEYRLMGNVGKLMKKTSSAGTFDLKRALITGGAGYFGSELARFLTAQGVEVWILDDESTGHSQAVPEDIKSAGRYIVADVTDSKAIQDIIEANEIGSVYHLAAKTLMGDSVEQPALYYYTNVIGTMAVAEAIKETEAKNPDRKVALLNISTCGLYDDTATEIAQGRGLSENSSIRPTAPYTESKLLAEKVLAEYLDKHNIQSVTIRPFNIVGASEDGQFGEDTGHATHLITVAGKLVTGELERMQIFGNNWDTSTVSDDAKLDLSKHPELDYLNIQEDKTPIREYIYVRDICKLSFDAINYMVSNLREGDEVSYRAFNGGTAIPLSTLRVVGEHVFPIAKELDMIDRQPNAVIGPVRDGDDAVKMSDMDRAEEELNFSADTPISEIVRTHLMFLKNRPEGYADDKSWYKDTAELKALFMMVKALSASEDLSNQLKTELLYRTMTDLTIASITCKDSMEDIAQRKEQRKQLQVVRGNTLRDLPINEAVKNEALIGEFKNTVLIADDLPALTLAYAVSSYLNMTNYKAILGQRLIQITGTDAGLEEFAAQIENLQNIDKSSSAGFFRSFLPGQEKIAPVNILHLVAGKGKLSVIGRADDWVIQGSKQEEEFRTQHSKKEGYTIEVESRQVISARQEIDMRSMINLSRPKMTRADMLNAIKLRLVDMPESIESAFKELGPLVEDADIADEQIADKISELKASLDLSDPEVRLLEHATTDPRSLDKHNTKSSSAGVFDNVKPFLKDIAQLNTGNLIAINSLDYAEDAQREEVQRTYDINSQERKDLENELGCTIRLTHQIAEDDIKGKEVVHISDADFAIPHSELATRIKRVANENVVASNRYPLAFTICFATQLFGDKTLAELEQALNRNRLFTEIFGQPATRNMIQGFLDTGFFKLPVPRFDYEKVEYREKAAILTAISA